MRCQTLEIPLVWDFGAWVPQTPSNDSGLCWCHFTGKDAFGTMHKKLDESAKKLREMFTLHLDLVAQDPDYPVPLPTYRRMPMDTVLSQRLGFKACSM